jgi:hypothetical protein
MKLTLKELNFTKHCIECAKRNFEKMFDDSKVDFSPHSLYCIYKNQVNECDNLIKKIDEMEI